MSSFPGGIAFGSDYYYSCTTCPAGLNSGTIVVVVQFLRLSEADRAMIARDPCLGLCDEREGVLASRTTECDGPRKPAACCALRAHHTDQWASAPPFAKRESDEHHSVPRAPWSGPSSAIFSAMTLRGTTCMLVTTSLNLSGRARSWTHDALLCRSRVQDFHKECTYAAARRIGANSAAAGAFKLTQPRRAREASTSRTMQCVAPRGRGSPRNTLGILTHARPELGPPPDQDRACVRITRAFQSVPPAATTQQCEDGGLVFLTHAAPDRRHPPRPERSVR